MSSCFLVKYKHISEQNQAAGSSELTTSNKNCEKCAEFTNNLSKYAIHQKSLNNNLKKKQYLLRRSAAMKNPEEKLSNIINFFHSLRLQNKSCAAGKHFKLTSSNVEYTVGSNFINILQSFVFGQDFHFDIFSDAYKSPKKDKKCLKSSQSSHIVQHKPPRKGTLRHQRWKLNKLRTDDNYEDDLFDSSQLSNSIELCDNDSDNFEKYRNAPTPKMNFSLSPRESAESSEQEDPFSTEDFQEKRKVAEEYQFRLKQKRKKPLKAEKHSPYSCAPKVDPDTALRTAARILEEWHSIQEDSNSASSHSSSASDLC